MAYLNKIKILDSSGHTSSSTPFNFGIGMLREDDNGNIVFGQKGDQVLLRKKDGSYTLDGTVLQKYIDERDTFLKKAEYADGKLIFTFIISDEDKSKLEQVEVPVNNFAVDADNIYFTEDFKVTTALGYFEPDASGYKNIEAKGKSIQQLFIDAFQKEDIDLEGIVYPSATFTFGGTGAYEVGTTIIPIVQVSSFSEGSYPYGTEDERKTGVEPTNITVSVGEASKTYSYTTGETNASDGIKITDGYSQTISAYVSYSDATNTPLSNIGNSQGSKKIPAGKTNTVTSAAITGYRAWFYGGDNGTILNSSTIRELTSSQAKNNFTLAAKDYAGCTRIIVAIPDKSNKTIKQVLLTSASNADITKEFKQQDNVNVEGNNSYQAAPYKVWVYSPAALDPTETYSITIG